ncbi:MAG: hypothetical protein J6W04_02685 [Bacteroidales bacterium]|nr:hypothetical protein [Bacteroidales bacterium]
MAAFNYNGEWFRPYRKLTRSEREQPLSSVEDKLTRFADEEFEELWDLQEFYRKSHSDADLFWWHGRMVIPSWDTFYILNNWL